MTWTINWLINSMMQSLHVEIVIIHVLSGVLIYKKYRFIQHSILYSKFEIPLVCNEIASSKVQPYNTVSFSCNLTQVCTSRYIILNLRIFCMEKFYVLINNRNELSTYLFIIDLISYELFIYKIMCFNYPGGPGEIRVCTKMLYLH